MRHSASMSFNSDCLLSFVPILLCWHKCGALATGCESIRMGWNKHNRQNTLYHFFCHNFCHISYPCWMRIVLYLVQIWMSTLRASTVFLLFREKYFTWLCATLRPNLTINYAGVADWPSNTSVWFQWHLQHSVHAPYTRIMVFWHISNITPGFHIVKFVIIPQYFI